MYLIDTNILSYLVDGDQKVEGRFIRHDKEICLATIVYAESVFGAKKIKNQGLVESYDLIFETYPVLSFDIKAAEIFTDLKTDLSDSGLIIEDFDLMIAATCLANKLTLVTNNTKHFKRIKNLKVEDWVK
jgi:tRNA(fMet)-specific endonuclease VapC